MPRPPASTRTIRAALIEAASRGFNNCLMLDMLGNVAEFGNANVFMAKDGVVFTPVPNGTFLNGITRQRVIDLLRGDGVTVVEKTLRYEDFRDSRRDLLDRQFRQGRAGDPDRRPPAAAGAVLHAGAQALLGLCARREVGGVSAFVIASEAKQSI